MLLPPSARCCGWWSDVAWICWRTKSWCQAPGAVRCIGACWRNWDCWMGDARASFSCKLWKSAAQLGAPGLWLSGPWFANAGPRTDCWCWGKAPSRGCPAWNASNSASRMPAFAPGEDLKTWTWLDSQLETNGWLQETYLFKRPAWHSSILL